MSELVDYIKDNKEKTQHNKHLTFSTGEEEYALHIKDVIDIVGIQEITQMPDQPEYVKGVINLRGRIIPAMDVRLRFHKKERDYDDRTCIIVVEIKGVSVGLIVDRVLEVMEINESNISQPPSFNNDFQNKYISGIGKLEDAVIILLDCKRLLSESEIEILGSLEQVSE